jgi:predicted glutamine amidotransferase
MVHLRWATLGLEIGDDNTHPFLADGISFEHNGSLKPIERIRGLLAPQSLQGMEGDTDSEMYLALIREKMRDGRTMPAATLAAARELRQAYPTASLNAILLDAENAVVVHASARTMLSDEDVTMLRQLDLPDAHADDYYSLQWLTKPDGTVLIGSTGVAEAGWQPMPAESVITIRLTDGRASIAPILTD